MAKVTDEEYNRSLDESRQLLADINAMEKADPWKEKFAGDEDYNSDPTLYPVSQVASPPKDNLRESLLVPLPQIEGESTNTLVTPQNQSLRKDAPPFFDEQEISAFSTTEDASSFDASRRPGFTPQYEYEPPQIDPRTNKPFGAVPEEQIVKDMIEFLAAKTSVYDMNVSDDWAYSLAKADPKYAQHYPNIVEVMKVHYQYISEVMDAQRMMFEVKGPNDIEGIKAAVAARDKAFATRQTLPLEYPMNGIVHETLRAMAETGASLVDIMSDAGPGAAAVMGVGAVAGGVAGALGTAAFGGEGAGPGAIWGTKLAMKYGVPMKVSQSMWRQGTGEMLLGMVAPTEEKQEPIPYEISRPIAELYAVPYAALELGGEVAELVAGFGFGAAITSRIVALASEGGTEWGQTLIENVATWAAQKEYARIRNVPFDTKLADVLDYHEAKLAARQAMLGTGGMAVVTSPVTVPLATRKLFKQMKVRREVKQIMDDLKKLEDYNNKIVDDNKDKPIDDVIDESTNTLVKGVPIDPAETGKVKGDKVVKGTDITNDKIDDLVITDDTDIDDALDGLDGDIDKSYDDITAEFFVGLKDHFQDDEKANLVEELLTARAQSEGISLSEYMGRRGMRFEHVDVDSDIVGAYSYLGQEGETIISAFNNADMVDVIGELGHIFRMDLDEKQKDIIDQFVGVDIGAEWDGRAGEKFANAWVQYIATGTAPSHELKGLFQKLASWITNIYKTIRGMDIPNLNIPPEMIQIFDSMLIKKTTLDSNTTAIDDASVDNKLNIPTIEEPPEIDDGEIIEPPEEPPVITPEEPPEIDDGDIIDDGEDIPTLDDGEVTPDPATQPKFKKVKPKKPKKKKIVPRMNIVTDGVSRITSSIPNEVNLENYVPWNVRGDRDIFDDIAGDTNSAEDVARWYMEHGDHEQQVIASRIVGLLRDIPFTVVELNTHYDNGIHRGLTDALGLYLPDEPTQRAAILVRGKTWGADAASNETPLHELVHAATCMAMYEARRLIDQGVSNALTKNYKALEIFLNQLNSAAIEQNKTQSLPVTFPYAALGRPTELVAYGMTSKVFQNWLSNLDMRIIDSKGHSKPIRAITKFVKIVRALLGIPASEETALIRAMQFGEIFIRTQKEHAAIQKSASLFTGIKPKDQVTYDTSPTNKLVEEQKARKEPTSNALVERIKREREARDRAIAAYDAAIANKIKAGTTPKVAAREQKKAMLKAMKAMFDAGDLHGYAIARDHFKAIVMRERVRFANQHKHKAIRGSIISKLERGMPSKVHGKLFVKINPDTAKLFREVLEVLHPLTTNDKIRAAYDARMATAATSYNIVSTDADIIINSFLSGAVSRNSSGIQILDGLNKYIASLLSGASAQSPMMQKVNLIKQLKNEIVNDINGGNIVDSPLIDSKLLYEQRQKQKTKKQKAITTGLWSAFGHKGISDATSLSIFGLTGLIKQATMYTPGLQSRLSKMADFFDAKQNKMTRIRQQQELIMEMYAQSFGLDNNKTRWALYSKWREDTKPVHTVAKVELSKAQVRQLWMYMQDPTLTNRLVMQFTDPAIRARLKDNLTEAEILDIMNDMAIDYNEVVNVVEAIMSDQDKAFSRLLMAHFNSDEQYQYVNTVHKKLSGIELGRINGYVPIRAANYLDPTEMLDRGHQASQFKHDDYIRKTPTSAKSIRERAKNADRYQIRLDGDITLFNSYTEEMAHYVNFGEQAQLLKIAIEDPDIRRAIEVEYGRPLYANIVRAIDDTLADGIHNRTQYPVIDSFRSTFVRSTIGLAGSVFLKQHISVVQYMQHMPVLNFMIGLGKFWMNPIDNFKEMLDTDFIKNRRYGLDRDMKQTAVSAEYKKWRLNPVLSNLLTLNVTVGDSSAIMMGAWVYKEHLKTQINPATGQKYTNKEALNEAFRKSNQTQQSGDMQELSTIQRGGSFAQIATTYSTGPVQAMRQEIEAWRDYTAGKISFSQMLKTIFIYHVLVPSMYAAVTGLISGRDEDEWVTAQLIAAALGPVSAIYTVGEVLDTVVQFATGMKVYPVEGMTADAAKGIANIIGKFTRDGDTSLEDWSQAAQSVLVFTGHGIPTTRITRTMQNIAEGNAKGALLQQRVEE